MRVDIRGIPRDPRLRADVSARLTAMLDRHAFAATGAEVGFVDENGPKGGPAIRCRIEVRLPRRPALDVHDVATTRRLAFDGALDKLDRQLGRDRGRRRERSRRPKKYYAAKRLLTGEPEPSGEQRSA
jgi:ribosome-associated translation inhibitor RaiA